MAKRRHVDQHGVALIAVLWTVAILTLLTTALLDQAKTEIRSAALAKEHVIRESNGKAALALTLNEIKSTGASLTRVTNYIFEYKGTPMTVRVSPANGFIDLNRAPASLIKAMLKVNAGLPESTTIALSEAILEKRKEIQAQSGSTAAFEAVEDLLQVAGFSYEIYRTISNVITINAQGTGRVNPLSAPREVLLILADGNVAITDEFDLVRSLKKTDVELDVTRFNVEYIDKSVSMRVKLEVYDNAFAQYPIFSKYVDLRGDRRSGQLWRILN